MKKLLIILPLLYHSAFADIIPPRGAVDVNITQENIKHTVCVPGYTKTVRPSSSYTNKLKVNQLILSLDKNVAHFEEDHLIPLAVGGHPKDINNLWPQPRSGEWNAQKKDILESFVHREMCKGRFTLIGAQDIFKKNWIDGYKKYIKSKVKLEHVD